MLYFILIIESTFRNKVNMEAFEKMCISEEENLNNKDEII